MTTDKSITVKARIADLNVLMHCKTAFMVRRLQEYNIDFEDDAQIEIDITEQQIEAYCAQHALMDRDNAEYMLSSAKFYQMLYQKFNGFLLHASAIAMDGEGYLFSANSGTGKSTHADFWKACYGERVQFINDDKPALRLTEDGWCVYGTPWSGKTALNTNICVPLKAVAFLHRSAENEISRMNATQIITNLMEQTIRPKTEQGMDKLFVLLDDLLAHVPFYSLGCNMSEAAAQFAYETMKQ